MSRPDEGNASGINILQTIGGTPLVAIRNLVPPGAAGVLAKLESFNPGGSVKDRIAFSMIEAAEERKLLEPGGVVIEPTSGNTGIGLAMVCAVKGYRCVLVMPETMSTERRKILKNLGAELVLTPGDGGMSGAVGRAEELAAETSGAYMPQQFKNPANPDVHRRTTGPEILRQTSGRIGAFVAGVGTGGTITGAGGFLKEHIPGIKIVAVEPEKSPVLSGGSPGPHRIQGIGAGFVPDVLDVSVIDRIIKVSEEDAFQTAKRLAVCEGIFCGVSSGAAMWAAAEIAGSLPEGNDVVVVLPDTGERYLSMQDAF